MDRLYDFEEQLAFSKGKRQKTDTATIQQMIAGCVSVEIAPTEMDRAGIDYIAILRGGAQIFIDAKARDAGCSQYWKDGPELALEDWSVIPENGRRGKVGWTLDEGKQTNLVLFTFDLQDTEQCFLLSFQLLRVAFRHNYRQWREQYKNDTQCSNGWRSHCIFVPASAVFDAIQLASTGVIGAPTSNPGDSNFK